MLILFMMFMLMSLVGVEFGVAVSSHNVCSSYVCAVCWLTAAVRLQTVGSFQIT
jgi:hypothetical protein